MYLGRGKHRTSGPIVGRLGAKLQGVRWGCGLGVGWGLGVGCNRNFSLCSDISNIVCLVLEPIRRTVPLTTCGITWFSHVNEERS